MMWLPGILVKINYDSAVLQYWIMIWFIMENTVVVFLYYWKNLPFLIWMCILYQNNNNLKNVT